MASSSSNEEKEAPSWSELPREITAVILQKMGTIEMLNTAQRVCTAWWSVCQDPSMWRCMDIRNPGDVWEVPSNLEIMCCHAVDLSQGQLIDINIESFGSDELLLYISQRSSQLRRLQLVFSYDITGDGLIQAIKNFPLLEELCLYYTTIDAKDIEAIGRSCPQLKSFKLNNRWYRKPYNVVCNMEARAIAQNMPELRHLQIFGNQMTTEGLQVILDGCPHLESLDLRQCFNIHFGVNISQLCTQKIRDLKRSHDSTNDYRFVSESLTSFALDFS